MKINAFLFTLITIGTNSFANSSVVADIQEINRLHQYDPLIPFSERDEIIKTITKRVRPIVQNEFAKLKDGEFTPLAQELLTNPETSDFCHYVLMFQIRAFSEDIQTKTLEKVFANFSDSDRGPLIRGLMHDLSVKVFAGNEIQKWIVDEINGREKQKLARVIKDGVLKSIGSYYFILTEENVGAVSETAISNMRRLSNPNKGDVHFSRLDVHFSQLSAIFLALHGNEEALELLESRMDKRDINADAGVILAAAMSGNEKLIKKIPVIATTDKSVRCDEDDCDHFECYSFAHEATIACSLTIEGFPEVKWFDEYDDEIKERVREWVEQNPVYTIKLDDPRVFLKYSSWDLFITPESK